jgi:hypothetical protein
MRWLRRKVMRRPSEVWRRQTKLAAAMMAVHRPPSLEALRAATIPVAWNTGLDHP